MHNKILKIMFIISAIIFLYSLLAFPKTNCEACRFEYNGKIIKGVEAYEIFEDACISYIKPWDTKPFYVDIDDINITYDEDGKYNITFNESYRNI
jgi:hypothetical protein